MKVGVHSTAALVVVGFCEKSMYVKFYSEY